jgi:hypothetical protein
MSQQELLTKIIRTLDAIAVDYMVTGSVASSFQGEPRSTHDIDIVIAIEGRDIPSLLKSFPPPDYHLDEESIRDAMATRNMFNLIDVRGGDKVDFWLLTDDPFDRSRFSRKREENFLGMKVKMSSPEDSILKKLHWAQLSGGSEKQFTDALRVYEVQAKHLDLSYIDSWAQTLSVVSLWERIKNEAQVME